MQFLWRTNYQGFWLADVEAEWHKSLLIVLTTSIPSGGSDNNDNSIILKANLNPTEYCIHC